MPPQNENLTGRDRELNLIHEDIKELRDDVKGLSKSTVHLTTSIEKMELYYRENLKQVKEANKTNWMPTIVSTIGGGCFTLLAAVLAWGLGFLDEFFVLVHQLKNK